MFHTHHSLAWALSRQRQSFFCMFSHNVTQNANRQMLSCLVYLGYLFGCFTNMRNIEHIPKKISKFIFTALSHRNNFCRLSTTAWPAGRSVGGELASYELTAIATFCRLGFLLVGCSCRWSCLKLIFNKIYCLANY